MSPFQSQGEPRQPSWETGSFQETDQIFGMLKETFPPTFNPYTAVKLLGGRLQGVIPQLMASRPDLAQELLPRLFAFPSELLSTTLKDGK